MTSGPGKLSGRKLKNEILRCYLALCIVVSDPFRTVSSVAKVDVVLQHMAGACYQNCQIMCFHDSMTSVAI